jgi:hypothetical protein
MYVPAHTERPAPKLGNARNDCYRKIIIPPVATHVYDSLLDPLAKQCLGVLRQ